MVSRNKTFNKNTDIIFSKGILKFLFKFSFWFFFIKKVRETWINLRENGADKSGTKTWQKYLTKTFDKNLKQKQGFCQCFASKIVVSLFCLSFCRGRDTGIPRSLHVTKIWIFSLKEGIHIFVSVFVGAYKSSYLFFVSMTKIETKIIVSLFCHHFVNSFVSVFVCLFC